MRGGTTSLISAMAMTGSCLMKSRNHMKNQPNDPSRMPKSTQVGRYVPHCHGSNSCESDGTTITNRSNHIPRLMNSDRMKSQVVLRRSFCDHRDIGRTMLQMSMIHAAQAHWPNTRFQKYSCSKGLPLIQATWNSVRYARPTTHEVKRHSFEAASRSLSVM